MMLKAIRQFFRGRAVAEGRPSFTDVERAEWVFYIQYLQPGMTAFDVGAFHGEVTSVLARFVRAEGRVYAFEASGANMEALRTLQRALGWPNVTLNHAVVTDHPGMASLHVYDEEHASWNSLADRPFARYGISLRPDHIEHVPAITIDDYCRQQGIGKIDLLKVDVEGAELQVLRGARRMFRERRVGCCLFEYGQTTWDMGNRPDMVQAHLSEVGYRVRNLIEGLPAFPGGNTPESAEFAMLLAEPQS